jgi:TRAP transporter TAXI family solute receptor
MTGKKTNAANRDGLKIFGPALLVTVVGFAIAFQFVDPAPPRTLTMATGSIQGAYFAAGQAYRDILADYDVTLKLINTAGAVENLRLLTDANDAVDVAIIQGGLSERFETERLVALGSIFLEPLWIFHRSEIAPSLLTDLKRLRIAVGPQGSGTRALAMQLLALNGITSANTQILAYDAQQASDKILNGDIDIAFFVVNHRAQFIRELSTARQVGLMGLARADAYTIRKPFLKVLRLPEGVLDLENNIPDRELAMLAPTAQLVARADLHPALIELLLQAAEKVHFKGGGFEHEGEFPSPKHLDYRLSPEAARFYESGPRVLQRYLPFWVANFISRMKVMLVPLILLLLPIFKLLPPVYRWRMRSKIYRWYARLEALDVQITIDKASADIGELLQRLDELEKSVTHVSVPLAFREELYDMRLHIEMLRNKLKNR